jgi:DNA replication protein DnaC
MTDSIIETKTCEIHGDYNIEYVDMGFMKVLRTLPHCQKCHDLSIAETQELEKAKQAEHAKRFKEQRITWAIENFEKWVPKRFADATIESFMATSDGQKRALKICNNYVEKFDTSIKKSGGGLIFTGNVGTGKTHLAIAVGRKLAAQGKGVMYVNLAELIRSVRATWKGQGSEAAILAELIGTGLLIIDEAGVQNGTDNERNILFEIIDGRYQDVKPTVVISNLNVEEVGAFISERSIDRITHGGAVVPFDWVSQRGLT